MSIEEFKEWKRLTAKYNALYNTPLKMEFSKMLMCLSGALFFAAFAVSVVSWFALGEIPSELLTYAALPFGLALPAYCGKSAYENKPKIERGWEDRA